MGVQWPFAPGGLGGWGGGGGAGGGGIWPTGQNPLGNNPTSTPTAGPAIPPPAPTGTPPAQPQGVTNQPPPAAPQSQPPTGTGLNIPPNLLPGPGGANNPQNSIVNYYQFVQWWQNNIGNTPPDFNAWSTGNINVATPGTQSNPNVAGGAGNPNTPDVLNGQYDFNSPEAFQQLVAGLVGGASPGLQVAGRDFDPDSRLNVLNELGGGFTGGPFGLPGQEGDAVAGVIANLLFNEANLQSGRGGEAESLLRDVMNQLGASESLGTSRQASALAGERLSPGSLDELRGSMQNDLSTSLAAEQNSSLNALRDLGLLGQGAASTSALGGLTNRLGALRQRGQFDITRQLEELTGQRLQQGLQASSVGADVERALGRDPAYALAQSLQGARNPVIGDINDFLQGILNLNVGEALSNRGGSFLNQGGGALLGSAFGAAGEALGSIGGMGGQKAPSGGGGTS